MKLSAGLRMLGSRRVTFLKVKTHQPKNVFIAHTYIQTIFTLPCFKQMQYFQNWDMTQLLVSLISSKPSVPLRAKLKKLEPFPMVRFWTVSEPEEVRAKLKELEPFLLLHMSQMVRFRTKPHQSWSHPYFSSYSLYTVEGHNIENALAVGWGIAKKIIMQTLVGPFWAFFSVEVIFLFLLEI